MNQIQLINAHEWESGLFLKSDLLDDNKTVDGDNMHKNSLHNAKYRNPINTISYQSTLILTKTSHNNIKLYYENVKHKNYINVRVK